MKLLDLILGSAVFWILMVVAVLVVIAFTPGYGAWA